MEATTKICHANLLTRIDELKILKAEQEIKIKEQFQDLKNSLNIGTVLKESINHLAQDKDTQKDIIKIATATGTNYVIEKVLGSNGSIKRYLASLLAEKVSNSFLGNLISRINL